MNFSTLFLTLFVIIVTYGSEILKRDKRFILYPRGGLFKLVLTLGVPVKLGLKQSMVWGVNFQFQYQAPQNLSQIDEYPPDISRSRDKRELGISDRKLAYLGIEETINKYGFDGRSCLLQSICENAQYSLHHQANGLYGELVHILLSPDYGDGIVEDIDQDFTDAVQAGRYGIDCNKQFSNCKMGINPLDIISLKDF